MKSLKIAAVLLFVFAVSQSLVAQNWWGKSVKGEGPVVKETLNLDEFKSIGLGCSATVYVEKGSTQKVVVEGQKNIIDLLKREVKGQSWNIGFEKNVYSHDKLIVYITIPDVDALSIGGSGKIISKSSFENLDDLKMSIGGSGTIEFSGSAQNVEVSIAGSGDVKASGLRSETCKVSIAGSGDCYIEAGERLDVSIAGSGDVHYKGRPRVKSSIAGSGDVESMD